MGDHSRVGRLGSSVAALSEEDVLTRLDASCVYVSAEPDLSGASLTLRIALNTLRRMPGRLYLDPRGLEKTEIAALQQAAEAIDRSRGLQIGEAVPEGAVHLHIGTTAPSEYAIRAVPDGYGLHVARDASVDISQARPPHVLGCVTSAAFAVAEVFKDLAPVVDDKRVDHAHLRWCPVSLSHDLTRAPMLATPLQLDLALAGCGAIGTAVAMILAEVDARGQVLLLDRETFAKENIATYSIGGEEDARRSRRKVDLVAERLQTKYTVTTRDGDVETLVGAVDQGVVRWPRLVINGLDSVKARHDIQLLWADRVIDAGTGGTAVALHDIVAETGPCLMCFFGRGAQVSTQERLVEVTGLALELVGRGDDDLLPEHIGHLSEEQRALLEPQLGKKICNLANALGLIAGASDFQAAVTFVAVQAACLAVGRLIAVELGMDDLPNFVLYDTLIGPRDDAMEQRKPTSTCYCQTKAGRVAKLRVERLARS